MNIEKCQKRIYSIAVNSRQDIYNEYNKIYNNIEY